MILTNALSFLLCFLTSFVYNLCPLARFLLGIVNLFFFFCLSRKKNNLDECQYFNSRVIGKLKYHKEVSYHERGEGMHNICTQSAPQGKKKKLRNKGSTNTY